MKKVMKKGKRGNGKERLVVYEEMKSLNENSTSSYRGFQNPKSIDEVVLKRLINEISTRKYEKAHWWFLLRLESTMLFPRRL
jgi:hypothetical protein